MNIQAEVGQRTLKQTNTNSWILPTGLQAHSVTDEVKIVRVCIHFIYTLGLI